MEFSCELGRPERVEVAMLRLKTIGSAKASDCRQACGARERSVPERHSTIRDGKRLIWYTENLWSKAKSLVPFEVELSSIRELDEDCWFGAGRLPTMRAIADHCARINSASFDWPIILNADGSLMDGGHRICRALLEGRRTIRAVQFQTMPEPDEVHAVA